MSFNPKQFAEKYQLAVETASKQNQSGGLNGFELEWTLLDEQFRPLRTVGIGPAEQSFVDYLRAESLSSWLREFSQLEVFHWMIEWATRPYYTPRGGGVAVWVLELVMPLALGLMALRFAWGASGQWLGRVIALAAIPAAFALGLAPDRLVSFGWPMAVVILTALVLGTPVFVAMAALALFFFFRDGLAVTAVTAEVYRLISSPTLPAIPLLTACGYVLAESHASLRLLRFFKSLLGWMPGGLAVIVIAVCALFTTFTGGSGITVIAVGGLVLPMLRQDGYPEGFSGTSTRPSR